MRPKAPSCACAYTDLDAEREFFNNLAYNIGSKPEGI